MVVHHVIAQSSSAIISRYASMGSPAQLAMASTCHDVAAQAGWSKHHVRVMVASMHVHVRMNGCMPCGCMPCADEWVHATPPTAWRSVKSGSLPPEGALHPDSVRTTHLLGVAREVCWV